MRVQPHQSIVHCLNTRRVFGNDDQCLSLAFVQNAPPKFDDSVIHDDVEQLAVPNDIPTPIDDRQAADPVL
jgi:hypothetical protein